MACRPRGTCPQCWANCAVTASGRIWAHNRWAPHPLGGFEGSLCPGTGQQPHRPATANR